MSKSHNIHVILGAVSAIALLACSSDVVDLGNDGLTQTLARSSQCTESPIVRGPVEVTRQQELEALSGCEEVRGDLHIRIYEGTDLAPLAALRIVSGRFTLGGPPETPAEDTWEEDQAARERAAAAGWLTSLRGVEALERVGSLEIERIAAPDLRAFSNLRNLAGNDDPATAGRLSISRTSALTSLSGLENATGVAELIIQENDALESLTGLRISAEVPRLINLTNNPALTDIFALAPLESTRFLWISGSAITDLDALQGFLYADAIDISNNPRLIEVFGIGGASFGELTLESNPRLAGVPPFVNGNNDSRIRVIGNTVLDSLSFALTVGFGSVTYEGQEFFIGNSWIEVSDNPRLQTLSIENEDPIMGITSGQLFAVHRNAALQRVDLGTLRRLDLLSLGDNPELTDVVLGALERADQVSVTGNPKLVTTELRAVPTFEGTFSGNADDAPAP